MQSVLLYLFGMCREQCPHRPADLSEDSNFLVQPHRNRPAEFARCTRCPPGACQRRLPIISPDMLDFMEEPLGMCREQCPHRLADLPEDSNFLVQPCRNRPAEFARCTRCPPVACQRRLPIISPDMLDFMEEPLGMGRGRCPHRPADLSEGSNFLGQPHRNRPAEFARTSLSAWGLPTPLVALACIGNVGSLRCCLYRRVTLFHTAFASLYF